MAVNFRRNVWYAEYNKIVKVATASLNFLMFQIDFVSLFQVSVWKIHFAVANTVALQVSK
jgi:hypothetical protein